MKVIDVPQRSPEWHAARLGIATGSGFSNILADKSTAAYRNYLTKLALEKITGKAQGGGFMNEAMKQGVRREPEARMFYEILTGFFVEEVGFCLHDSLPCGVSPDGLIGLEKGLEIKCVTPGKHLEYMGLKGAPSEYKAQIQGCLWVTERDSWDFVSYCPEFPENARLIVRTISRDEPYIERIADGVAMFALAVNKTAELIQNFKN